MATSKTKKPKAVHTIQQYYGRGGVAAYLDKTYAPKEGLSTRMVGIEVEVENFELLRQPRDTWILTEDGSLRNNGVEWITRPIQANYVHAALTDLFSAMSAECCFSPRTSVHVHVNCLDVQVDKITNIVMLYAIVENLLYRFAGRGRNKNIYCVPLHECNLLSRVSERGIEYLVNSWSKYAGLNLVPLADKGTIEFRHMHGTNDVNKLTTWVDMLTRLVDFVQANDVGNIRKLLYGMSRETNVRQLLMDVFGSDVLDALRFEGYSQIEDQVLGVKAAFMASNNLERVLKERDLTSPFFTTKIVKGI